MYKITNKPAYVYINYSHLSWGCFLNCRALQKWRRVIKWRMLRSRKQSMCIGDLWGLYVGKAALSIFLTCLLCVVPSTISSVPLPLDEEWWLESALGVCTCVKKGDLDFGECFRRLADFLEHLALLRGTSRV